MGLPGAYSRKLTYNALTSTLREDYEMCDTIATVDYHILDDKFLKCLDGRFYYDKDNNMKMLRYNEDKDLIGKVIRFRSPATCNSKDGVCKYCYGHMFDINRSMNSAGALAALKITEPIGQRILSSKHSQSTSSSALDFGEGFEDVFENDNSVIMLRDDSNVNEELMIRLNDIQIEEMDDSEFYSCLSYDLITEDGELFRHIEEAGGSKFYLGDRLVALYKAKLQTKNPTPIFNLNDIDDDEALFTVEVKNKELTEPLKIFTMITNTRDHGGATTVSQLCQMFAENLLKMGINYEFAHMEMLVRGLLRKKSNNREFPDFSIAGNPNDYQIMKLDEAQMQNPSVLVSMPFGYLRRQLMSPELYEKTATGPLDALYVANLFDYI